MELEEELNFYVKKYEEKTGVFLWRRRSLRKKKGYFYDKEFGDFLEGDKLYIKRLKGNIESLLEFEPKLLL